MNSTCCEVQLFVRMKQFFINMIFKMNTHTFKYKTIALDNDLNSMKCSIFIWKHLIINDTLLLSKSVSTTVKDSCSFVLAPECSCLRKLVCMLNIEEELLSIYNYYVYLSLRTIKSINASCGIFMLFVTKIMFTRPI